MDTTLDSRSRRPQTTFSIHPETRVGHVRLKVRDLDRMGRFYQETLGFQAMPGLDLTLVLTADGQTPLFVLEGDPDLKLRPKRTSGLYHAAVRVPSRIELARFLRHLIESGVTLQGAADHLVSEALYLADPEGNGLEFYRDYPREQWPVWAEVLREGNAPLSAHDLLGEVDKQPLPWQGLHPGTVIGHVHLSVADLTEADAFFHGLLGFERTGEVPEQANFVAAGGYHHHIAYNLWAGRGAPQPPPGSTGLVHFTLVLPDRAALMAVLARVKEADHSPEERDGGYLLTGPSGIRIRLEAAGNGASAATPAV